MSAEDIRPKSRKIFLGGKERNIVFDMNAFIALEDIYPSLEDAIASLESKNLKAVRALLWAAVVHEDESLTLKEVGSWITLANLTEVSKVLSEAVTASIPQAQGGASSGN